MSWTAPTHNGKQHVVKKRTIDAFGDAVDVFQGILSGSERNKCLQVNQTAEATEVQHRFLDGVMKRSNILAFRSLEQTVACSGLEQNVQCLIHIKIGNGERRI